MLSTLSRRINRFAAAAIITAVGSFGLIGCETDSNMDPSITGRWEQTPVVLPILDRLDIIESPDEDLLGVTQITSADLIPQVTEYVMGPGDLVTVTVYELITPGVETVQTRRIDELGFIRLPEIGQIKASGLSTRELEQKIINILHPEKIRDPQVTVVVQEGRQKTFTVFGAVPQPGTYTLLKTDFRLLDAIALAGGVPTDTETIYVIRHVPLSDLIEGVEFGEPAQPGETRPSLRPEIEQEMDAMEDEVDRGQLLESLMGEEPADNGGAVSPGDLERAEDELNGALDEPTEDESIQPEAQPGMGLSEALDDADNGRWVNIDNQWVRVETDEPAATGEGGVMEDDDLPPPDELITQRIIEVDAEALMKGLARHNLVIRPGDIIRVPLEETGNIYLDGQVARPGTYALPGERTLTLKNALAAAGGLSPIGIPERVDLIRRLDNGDSEAMIRINARAIFEGVTPDFYLKPHDQIVVGTNLPASYLAVIRNSFRMSYGFGFLLDRNFGPEVFGPVPQDRR